MKWWSRALLLLTGGVGAFLYGNGLVEPVSHDSGQPWWPWLDPAIRFTSAVWVAGAVFVVAIIALRARTVQGTGPLALFYALFLVGTAPNAPDWVEPILTPALYGSLGALCWFSVVYPRKLSERDMGTSFRRYMTRPKLLWTGVAVVAASPLALSFLSSADANMLFVAPFIGIQLVGGWALLLAPPRNLWTSYLLGDPSGRRAVLWVYLAGLAGVITVLVAVATTVLMVLSWPMFGTAIPRQTVDLIGGVGIMAVTSIVIAALLFSDTLDPYVALRRTTVYSMVGLSVTVLFASVDALFISGVADFVGLSPRLGAWVASVSCALLFHPIRVWVDRRIGQRVDRTLERVA